MSKFRFGLVAFNTYGLGLAPAPLNWLGGHWWMIPVNAFSTIVGTWLLLRGRWVRGPIR